MKILSINKQQNNVNFGLYNRHLANSQKLIQYWCRRGFSDDAIQTAILKLENYKKTNTAGSPLIDFICSIFFKDKNFPQAPKKFPAIDFGDIKTDRITKCSYGEIDIIKENVDIPNILYSFAKSAIPMPMNKVFKTPLEKAIHTSSGITLEPKTPLQVVKEIIKNYKIFAKQSATPNDYFAPSQGRTIANMKVSFD